MNISNAFMGGILLFTAINIALPDIKFESICVKIFLLYSIFLANIKRNYNDNRIISYITDYLRRLYKSMHNIKTEPEKLPWINVFMMNGDEEMLNDYSYIIPDNLQGLAEKYKNFVEEYVDQDFIDLIEDDHMDVFFTMKTDQMYICSIYNEYVNDDIKLTANKSSVSFISIEYTHPLMSEPIQIELHEKWYYDGNEILSKLFIQRYLMHQCLPYVFTDDYLVNIIDSDVNQISLNKNQYILLKPDEYKIITFGNDDDE
jgi:hypothetical protein